jgi:hypothetical protein
VIVIVIVRVFVMRVVLFGHLVPPLDRIVRDPGAPVDSGSLPLSRGGR